jgi:hypothetical protein
MLMADRKKDSDIVTFSCEKTRDIPPTKFQARVVFSEDKIRVVTVATAQESTKELSASEKSVLDFLKQEGKATMKQIKSHNPQFQPAASRQAFYFLKQKKLVARLDEGKGGQKGMYGPFKG